MNDCQTLSELRQWLSQVDRKLARASGEEAARALRGERDWLRKQLDLAQRPAPRAPGPADGASGRREGALRP